MKIVILFLSIFISPISFSLITVDANQSTIPVVNLQEFFNKQTKEKFVQDLSVALQNVGFVAVLNPGLDAKILDKAYQSSEDFFSQSIDYKLQYLDANLSGQRGYVQSEKAKGFSKKDIKEFFHIGREPVTQTVKYNYLENIWPSRENFRENIQNLISELDNYMIPLQRAIALSIGQQENYFDDMTKSGDYLVRMLHYPNNPPKNGIWAAEHTDISLFTMIPRASAPGLEVKNDNGEWIKVLVPDNAFIVNSGDLLRNLTNGVYKSSIHRVKAHGKGDRYSIVAFVHPRFDDDMSPLPQCIARVGHREFPNATQKDLLSERLADLGLASISLLRDLSKSGLIEQQINLNKASIDAIKQLHTMNLATPFMLDYLHKNS